MMTRASVTQVRNRVLRRAGRIGIYEAQVETRDRLEEAVAAYAALRQATGTHANTIDVELRDGTPVTALVAIDLVPTAQTRGASTA